MLAAMQDVNDAVGLTESVADSQPMGWLARLGLTARGCVYLIMGLLAVLLALGSRQHVDQRGALTELIAQPFGSFLVLLLAVGFASYAAWRFSEALVGIPGESGAGPRLKSLARGIVYAVLAFTAVSVLLGARSTQSGQQGHIARDVMDHTGGRLLVGLVGVGIMVVAAAMIHEGWSKKFLRYFGCSARAPPPRRGRARPGRHRGAGVVFAVAGFLVVVAAWTASPSRAGGVDEAFKTLLGQPYGRFLVLALGLGLMIFGVYGLAEAAWRRVPGSSS